MTTTMRAAKWGEGAAMGVRGVLAARFIRGREVTAVTHVVIVDAEGDEQGERTLCGRIKVEALADVYATELARPTCPGCLKRAGRA